MSDTPKRVTDDNCWGYCRCPYCGGSASWSFFQKRHACADRECATEFAEHDDSQLTELERAMIDPTTPRRISGETEHDDIVAALLSPVAVEETHKDTNTRTGDDGLPTSSRTASTKGEGL